VVLVHTQKIGIQSEKPTWTKALEFTQFACPCGTDPRLLSGEQRTSHFKLVTSVFDPKADIHVNGTVSLAITSAVAGLTPRHQAKASAACSTSMPTPSQTRATPDSRARRKNGVNPLP
jgi:hypothetical protein